MTGSSEQPGSLYNSISFGCGTPMQRRRHAVVLTSGQGRGEGIDYAVGMVITNEVAFPRFLIERTGPVALLISRAGQGDDDS